VEAHGKPSEPLEPLDEEIAQALVEPPIPPATALSPASVLVVHHRDDAALQSLLATLRKRRHHLQCVVSLNDALAAIAREPFDLVLLNTDLSDGDGLQLAQFIQSRCPATKTVMLSQRDSAATVVEAMRFGAIDFIRLPVSSEEFAARLDAAVLRCRADQVREQKMSRLKEICRKLNIARHQIGEQVDSLCQDLVNAYQEFAEQMNDVQMSAEFRTLIRQELDVEDLLRTALQYMLTKTGPTNAAVFLPDANEHFTLGAYVNYDCPRESISVLLDHLGGAICPQMAEESEIVSFDDAADFAEFIGAEASLLAESQVIAFTCEHDERCLAVFVLFRDKSEPFADDLGAVIEILRPIFAEQIAKVVRIHHRGEPEWPSEAIDDDFDFNDESDYGFGLAA